MIGFNVMPFGLCNAPTTFQGLMERVLVGMQWEILVLYLNDVVIYSVTFLEHMAHLWSMFQRLHQARVAAEAYQMSAYPTPECFPRTCN